MGLDVRDIANSGPGESECLSYKDIPNHFSFPDVYDEAVDRAASGSRFVEVGTWFGASAAYMGMKIRDSGKQITFYAIDNFTAAGSGPILLAQAAALGGSFYTTFCDNMKRCGISEYVEPICGDSTESASLFKDRSLDFVYIDACHEYSKVRLDILAWLPKVKSGGTLAGHDYNRTHPGVRRAVDEIFRGCELRIKISSWVIHIDEKVQEHFVRYVEAHGN